ncbi:MAG: asparaginase [Rhodospirillaceae bacterium]|jgi:L-asparaginase|nr:asparaginase [Rhodospirillaceae bacterium]
MADKPRIAHLSGSNATISNSPPLVTSNKARQQYGLPPLTNTDGSPQRFDVLRPQRLAAPATLYVEQFSAHPLEADAAELYGPPDGYLDTGGAFHPTRQGDDDRAVYRVELTPEDGLYPLPYMARQADGSPWEDDCAYPGAPAEQSRQPYYPDGSRIFEEIDRFSIAENGSGNLISARAEMDFFRVLPSSGYTKGLPADQRTDTGDGDIPPESLGEDYFVYRPRHLSVSPPRPALARIANEAQRILDTGDYLGAIWTQGSPRIEETLYWLNLLLDTHLPVIGNAAQRPHGEISNDGPKNLVDSVDYITSKVWQDDQGRNKAGMVVIQEQQIFASREVQKGDARPGGYIVTGGHGGLLGGIRHGMDPILTYLPGAKHSWQSDVNRTRIPQSVEGIVKSDNGIRLTDIPIKDGAGNLIESAVPHVSIVKDGNYTAESFHSGPEREVDTLAQIDDNLRNNPLAGFVIEGQSPYGSMTNKSRERLLARAIRCGMPVVRVGRGNNEGFSSGGGGFIGGSNLTSTKARLLLIACLMRFGALPPAADPDNPTDAETAALNEKIADYQRVFETH